VSFPPAASYPVIPEAGYYRTERGVTGAANGRVPGGWIGVDLNTTGHVVVAAEPVTGRVLRLGKTLPLPRQSSRKCTKLYREGKLWKLKRYKSRERKMFKAALNTISCQIVSFAEAHCSGIKLEKLFSDRLLNTPWLKGQSEFSFENGSFIALQRLVERRANEQGIPVLFVNPAYTSKRCSRCGGLGRRLKKRFECPVCGTVIHADVNAALNIAMTPHHGTRQMVTNLSRSGKKIRRRITSSGIAITGPSAPVPATLQGGGILSFLE